MLFFVFWINLHFNFQICPSCPWSRIWSYTSSFILLKYIWWWIINSSLFILRNMLASVHSCTFFDNWIPDFSNTYYFDSFDSIPSNYMTFYCQFLLNAIPIYMLCLFFLHRNVHWGPLSIFIFNAFSFFFPSVSWIIIILSTHQYQFTFYDHYSPIPSSSIKYLSSFSIFTFLGLILFKPLILILQIQVKCCSLHDICSNIYVWVSHTYYITATSLIYYLFSSKSDIDMFMFMFHNLPSVCLYTAHNQFLILKEGWM